MAFQPPVYDHRAYYIFDKSTGRIVHSHRFITIRGDDTLVSQISEDSLIAEAAASSGEAASNLGVHLEIGGPRKTGHIAGYDLQSRQLIIEERPLIGVSSATAAGNPPPR